MIAVARSVRSPDRMACAEKPALRGEDRLLGADPMVTTRKRMVANEVALIANAMEGSW